ncbi:hypothetical protein M9Y10_033960 [Tritrichomonas musculus]|uniref:Uncharacterized protein n=1 Tax=Tritrichomonas musculus TaxID=1915356 RepID=A0ABR2KDL3_9EUKA
MSIKEWFEKFENIQSKLLEYIESEANVEEKYENFISAINDVCENKEELKLFLHLLLKISNNHFHTSNFFQKIDKILLTIKDDLKKNFFKF